MALSWSFFPFPFYGCTIIGWLTHGLEISGCFLSLSIIKRLYDHLCLYINVRACKVHVCVMYVHDHVDGCIYAPMHMYEWSQRLASTAFHLYSFNLLRKAGSHSRTMLSFFQLRLIF